jgi:hypothetical protein
VHILPADASGTSVISTSGHTLNFINTVALGVTAAWCTAHCCRSMGNCCSSGSGSADHARGKYERQRTQSGAGAARKAPSFTLNRQEGTPSR